MSSPNFIAGGSINPARFVRQNGNDFEVVQCVADEDTIGVSFDNTRMPPGVDGADAFHARLGESVGVHGQGEECLLTYGGSVQAGDYLKPDASGQGVKLDIATAAGTHYYGAKALEDGAAGELRRVVIQRGVFKVA